MWTEHLFLVLCGAAAGAAAASGVTAFLTILKIIPRMIGKSHTAAHVLLYENIIILGIIAGNVLTVFLQMRLPLGHIFLVIYGVCVGLFVGCIAVALAEILKAFPILFHRLKIRTGMWILMLSMALGKAVGSLYFFFHGISS